MQAGTVREAQVRRPSGEARWHGGTVTSKRTHTEMWCGEVRCGWECVVGRAVWRGVMGWWWCVRWPQFIASRHPRLPLRPFLLMVVDLPRDTHVHCIPLATLHGTRGMLVSWIRAHAHRFWCESGKSCGWHKRRGTGEAWVE